MRPTDILVLAATFGLFTGLLEGAGLLFLQKGPLARETLNIFFVPSGILYVSPLTDLVLCVAVAFLTIGIFRLARPSLQDRALFFILIFFLVFDLFAQGFDRVLDPRVIVILSAGVSAALERGCRKHTEQIVRIAWRSLPALAIAVVLLMSGVQVRQLGAEQRALAGLPPAPRGAANVLIVVMDTVRADHISALGYPRATTPNLDRLASQGVLFENAFSTSSWTLPAHASLLTGRYPFEHGAEVLDYDGRYPTLPQAFEARGYRTGAFSANTYCFARGNGFGPGFLHFDGVFTSLADAISRTLYGRLLFILQEDTTHDNLPGRKSAVEINSHFLHWLQQDPTRPFFAVLNYFDAHSPYLPPAPFRSRFSTKPNPGGILNPWGIRESLDRPEDVRDETDAYDGGIAFEDEQFSRLIASLRNLHSYDNMIVVVLADHGEFFGEHGLFQHGNALFLEGIHVPLLMLWPGHLPAGVRVRAPVSIASLPATLMELVPGQDRIHFPGDSLARLWSGSSAAEESPLILSELVSRISPGFGKSRPRSESLLTSRWHLIYSQGEQPQLFDWRADPREQRSLDQSAEGRPIAAWMLNCLNDHRSLIRQPDCGLSAAQPPELAGSFSSTRSAP